MQARFSASNPKGIQKACLKEIRDAKRKNAAIIFLEYSYSGPTIKKLYNEARSYDRTYRAIKDVNDGSPQCHKVITHYSLPYTHIRVVGVNTEYCVYSTVEGLNKLYPTSKIEVVAKACNSAHDHQRGLTNMAANLKTVLIVP